MDDNNPRPAQRPRIDGPDQGAQAQPAAQRGAAVLHRADAAPAGLAPVDIERDREVNRILHGIASQSAGAPRAEARYENSRTRGGGNEFRSFHAEMNDHIASREPNGENTRRPGANGRDLPVQTAGQSSREGLDHSGETGRAPASLAVADMGRSNLDIRRRDERSRNPIEID